MSVSASHCLTVVTTQSCKAAPQPNQEIQGSVSAGPWIFLFTYRKIDCPFFSYQVFLKRSIILFMKHTRTFELAEQLMVKAALMDKMIEGFKSYKPFNIDSAAGVTGKSTLAGAGIGALIGGGSAALQNAFTKDEDEDGNPKEKASILGRALAGAGIGGLGGAALPQVGMAMTPYLNRRVGEQFSEKATRQFDEKWPEGKGGDVMQELRQAFRDKIQRGSAASGRMLSSEMVPEITIGQIIEALKNKNKQAPAQ